MLAALGLGALGAAWAARAGRSAACQRPLTCLAEVVTDACYPRSPYSGLNGAAASLIERALAGLVSPCDWLRIPDSLPAFQGASLRSGREDAKRPLAAEFWAAMEALRPAGQPYAVHSAHEFLTVCLFVAALTDPAAAHEIRKAALAFAASFKATDAPARIEPHPAGARPVTSEEWAYFGTTESDLGAVVYRYPLKGKVGGEDKLLAPGWCGPPAVSGTEGRAAALLARAAMPPFDALLAAGGALLVGLGVALLALPR